MKIKSLLTKTAIGLHLLAPSLALALDATWTGSTSNQWNLAGNWNSLTAIPDGLATFQGTTGTVNVNAPTQIGKIRLNNSGNWTFTGASLIITGQETGSGTRPLSVGSGVQAVFQEGVQFTQSGYPQMDISASAANTKITFEKGIQGNSAVSNYSFQSVSRTAASAEVNIKGAITDIAEIVWRTQNSTLNLSASSSVSIQTHLAVNNLHLQLGHANALGSGTLNINSTAAGSVIKLEALGQARSYSNEVVFNSDTTGTGAIKIVGSHDLTFTGNAVLSRAVRIDVDPNRRFELAGDISSPTSDRSITKLGAGTLVLSGSSINATGGARVSEGTLLINGTMVAYTTTQVNATDTGVLGGTGTILRNVVFEAGANGSGRLNAGDSAVNGGIGTLTIGTSGTNRNLTLLSNTQLTFDLKSTAVHDLVVVNGNLTLDGVLNLEDKGVTALSDFLLIRYTGTLTNNGLDIGTIPVGWNVALDLTTANEVWLRMNAIPEPSTVALLLGAGLAIVLRVRQRSRS